MAGETTDAWGLEAQREPSGAGSPGSRLQSCLSAVPDHVASFSGPPGWHRAPDNILQ